MKGHFATRTVLGLILLAAALASAPAQAAKRDSRFRVRADLLVEYTDNLFHFADATLEEFGTRNQPGERFAGLDSESDVVGRARLRLDYRRRVAKKRDLRLVLKGAGFRHADNEVADYGEVELGAGVDVTRRDHLDVAFERTLDRFKKNYRIANTTLFGPSAYDQTDAALGYRRDLGRKRRHRLELRLASRERRFNDTFRSRDLDGSYLGLGASYRLSKRADGETRVEFGDVDSGTEVDAGILLDRSYEQYRVTQTFEFELRKRVRLGIELRFRQRDYTTDVSADLGRFDRTDEYRRLRIELEREWKNGLTLVASGARIDNDSERIDPTVEIDETGYDEFVVGLGLGFRF